MAEIMQLIFTHPELYGWLSHRNPLWVNRPLEISQLSLSSFRGR